MPPVPSPSALRHQGLVVLAALALGAAAAGCRRAPEPEADDGPAPFYRKAPLDHVAVGELREGTEKAFALALPVEVRRTNAFVDAVHGESRVAPVDAIAGYVAARVRGEGGAAVRGTRTDDDVVFDGVYAPGEDARRLRIEVRRGPLGSAVVSTLLVRDVTPVVDRSLPDPDARMRDAGLAIDGTLLDPKRLE